MHVILSRYIQIWHFYRTLSRGLLCSWTQCIYSCALNFSIMKSGTNSGGNQNSWAMPPSRKNFHCLSGFSFHGDCSITATIFVGDHWSFRPLQAENHLQCGFNTDCIPFALWCSSNLVMNRLSLSGSFWKNTNSQKVLDIFSRNVFLFFFFGRTGIFLHKTKRNFLKKFSNSSNCVGHWLL